MTYYKVVSTSMESCHGGTGAWEIGVERRVALPLVPCRHGLHVCRIEHLSVWPVEGFVLEVDIAGTLVPDLDKIVVESATPIRVVGAMTPRLLREFACDCAERALLREREAGREPDPRLWVTIDVARRFARGEVTMLDMAAAVAAAASVAASVADSVAYADSASASVAASASAAAARAAAAAAGAVDEHRWQGERLLALLGGAA